MNPSVVRCALWAALTHGSHELRRCSGDLEDLGDLDRTRTVLKHSGQQNTMLYEAIDFAGSFCAVFSNILFRTYLKAICFAICIDSKHAVVVVISVIMCAR